MLVMATNLDTEMLHAYKLSTRVRQRRATTMSLHKLTTAIMTGLLAGAALAADPPNRAKPTEESVADEVRRSMQCRSFVPLQGQINCTLS
jgi:hypothetical protein